MKKKMSLLLASLLLFFSLPLHAGAESSDLAAFFSVLFENVAHGVRVAMEEENEPPKVIDHIHFPNEYPDFAFSGEDDLLEIWFPPVRDQDATIFRYQDQIWMVDCGDERAKTDIVPLLQELGITKIDRIFNTHPHHDHLNGLYAIDAVAPVGELLICFPEDLTSHMTAAMEYCKANQIPVTTFHDEATFMMRDGGVSFLAWLKVSEEENLNDQSAQFMVSYGGCSMLIMADMELRGQAQLYEALGPEPLKADILRYPHHGKKAMNESLFRAIAPSLAIITNSPRIYEISESTRFLDYKHVPAAYTHRANIILHLVTDGHRWLCEEIPFDPSPWLREEPTPLPWAKEDSDASDSDMSP